MVFLRGGAFGEQGTPVGIDLASINVCLVQANALKLLGGDGSLSLGTLHPKPSILNSTP
jgi:hypothetical protein